MQLLIVNRDHRSYLRGDILAVVPDTHVWSPLEVAALWLANDPLGLPDEYKTASEGGTFPDRTTANFPNPQFAAVQFPSYRADCNLAEPWLTPDIENPEDNEGTKQQARRLWFLDLDALPPGVRNSIEQPGGQAQLGANRLSAIKERKTGTSITDLAGWELDTAKGNELHRFPGSSARAFLGVGASPMARRADQANRGAADDGGS